MSDLQKYIERVRAAWRDNKISQAKRDNLIEAARRRANSKGEFGPRDRDELNQKFNEALQNPTSGASKTPASGGPNPSTGGATGGNTGGTDTRPPQPGAAWVWSPSLNKWVKPASPGDGTHTWDDNRGWIPRPPRPGSAWEWVGSGGVGSWQRPPMPTDGGNYTWDDNQGWVRQGQTGSSQACEDVKGAAPDGFRWQGSYVTNNDGTISDTCQLVRIEEDAEDEPEADREREQRESASAFFRGLLAQFGFNDGDIGGLMGLFDQWIAEGLDNEAIMMKFRGTDVYQRRFPGMKALSNRGQAISEAEYIRLESAYRGVLSSYGLPSEFFDSPDDYGQFIANNVSPNEVEERAATGMRILQSADPRILAELGEYYGVNAGSALAYLLDANKAQELIRRQVRAATIGGSAERFGFSVDRIYSEQLAGTSLGQTIDAMSPAAAAQLDQSFATARRTADRERTLAAIDNERFVDRDAVSAMFGDLGKQMASEQRARREKARFTGTSGIGAGTFSVERNL